MKRLGLVLGLLALVAGGQMTGASASDGVCVFAADVMTLGTGVQLTPPNEYRYEVDFEASGSNCRIEGTFTVVGCELGNGVGTATHASDFHLFVVDWAGGMAFTGAATGVLTAVPEATSAHNCVSPASRWIVDGVLALV